VGCLVKEVRKSAVLEQSLFRFTGGMDQTKKYNAEIGKFTGLFNRNPEYAIKSPARVNIIGEHTDYNEGFVFPAAINCSTHLVAAKNGKRQVRIYSTTYNEMSEFSLDKLKRSHHWSDYVKGVAKELIERDSPVEGFDAVIGGDIPIASGLSSSASLEMAVSEACSALFRFSLEAWEQIKLCRRAENHFVGVNCGIMDQFSIRMGRRGHGLVSCKELDLLVDLARMVHGVLGARMTGAGFGGCTINLVMRNRVEEFKQKVGSMYKKSTRIMPKFYVTQPEDGVSSEKL